MIKNQATSLLYIKDGTNCVPFWVVSERWSFQVFSVGLNSQILVEKGWMILSSWRKSPALIWIYPKAKILEAKRHWPPLSTRLPHWLSSKESACSVGDEEDTGSMPGWGRSLGGGHGKPLQYSCLEKPMDRGVWWATAHRIAKIQTQLKQLSTAPPSEREFRET